MAAPVTCFIPRDSGARSVGADEVAQAIADEATRRGVEVRIVRNGSWGMYFLEPLVEVLTDSGRVAYGPVGIDDVPTLFDAGFLAGGVHRLAQGLTSEIDFLSGQERRTFARVGLIDPVSLEDYVANGGLVGLRRALQISSEEILAELQKSGLRGRGGAGFPTWIKWKTVYETANAQKYVCANADEGDSGTFADRMLMEGDPFSIIEGMAIAAVTVGATEGFIYIRSEYPDAIATMTTAIEIAEIAGILGDSVLESGKQFSLQVRVGAGAYICGEETAMLESLEGRRGMVRAKPPLPAHEGLFNKPTVINNLLSLAAVPDILANGGDVYGAFGVGTSRGTQVFQLAGNVARGGIVERGFGITLGELISDFARGTRSGRPVRAVQVGGPLGAYLPVEQLDVAMDYEAFAAIGAMVGHGGIVVFDDQVDMARQARFAMEFCAEESCGKCTPCRIGSVRGVEVIDKIVAGEARDENLVLLEDLCELMTDGSLCAMGGLTPMPVKSALQYFPEDFDRRGARQ
jgi:formate dehydrogenase iron-sulfur subunit